MAEGLPSGNLNFATCLFKPMLVFHSSLSMGVNFCCIRPFLACLLAGRVIAAGNWDVPPSAFVVDRARSHRSSVALWPARSCGLQIVSTKP